MANGYFPGKKAAKRSEIMTRDTRSELRDLPPLGVGGTDLVEGTDRVMQAPAAPVKVARIYLRVSTEAQDLARQEAIATSARAAGFYVAGIYREKASGARADRPELLRMIDDLQPHQPLAPGRCRKVGGLDPRQGRTLGGAGNHRPGRTGDRSAGRGPHRPGVGARHALEAGFANGT